MDGCAYVRITITKSDRRLDTSVPSIITACVYVGGSMCRCMCRSMRMRVCVYDYYARTYVGGCTFDTLMVDDHDGGWWMVGVDTY